MQSLSERTSNTHFPHTATALKITRTDGFLSEVPLSPPVVRVSIIIPNDLNLVILLAILLHVIADIRMITLVSRNSFLGTHFQML